jgi:hypothetical protein
MANELTPEKLTTVGNAVYSGNKIEAIKFYRTATGKDLKDSKDAVEKLAAELEARNPPCSQDSEGRVVRGRRWCSGARSPR